MRPHRPLLLALLLPAAAAASPLDDPHVGGVGFSGPTTGDLAAVYWNPAALGLIEGAQVTVAGGAQLARVSVHRAAIDPATGAPGAGRSFAEAAGRGQVHPGTWPPGPGSFAAIGAAIGNRFALAVAAYTPFFQKLSYAPQAGGDEPTRHHLIEADLRNIALVPALAIRVGNALRIGAAPGFLFSAGRMVFDEDVGGQCDGAPCGAENPAAAARYDIDGGVTPFDSTLSFTLAGGLYYRQGPIAVGATYASQPLGNEGGGVVVDADRAVVRRPARDGAAAQPCPPERPQGCVVGQLGYGLPDIYTVGATWFATERLAVTGALRLLTWSRHRRVSVRVVGPPGALRGADLPERVVLQRGWNDVVEGRARVERLFGEALRLTAGLRVESAAVPADAQNAGAPGGPILEPMAAAELRLGRWLRLVAGYAFAISPRRSTDGSRFDPGAAAACAAADGDLEHPACVRRQEGAARPTAEGEYGWSRHTLTLSAAFRL